MSVCDPATGRTLGGVLVRGETESETKWALEEIKKILPRPPVFCVCDFSPQLEAALRAAFPEAIIGHDYFHATQHLYRGLKKEMSRLHERECRGPAREYRAATRASLDAGRGELETPPQFEQRFLRDGWKIFEALLSLGDVGTLGEFEEAWATCLEKIKGSRWTGRHALLPRLEALVPKRGFTPKSLAPTVKRAHAAWRRVVRDARDPIENRATRFHKAKFLILANPLKATPEIKTLLRSALADYPWLRPLRKAVRDFHRQFATGPEHWRSLSFLQKVAGDDAHPDLRSAVNTLVAEQDQIFAYRDIWARYPALAGNKGIRSNREDVNPRLNRAARNQCGIRSTRAAIIRVAGLTGAPVIASAALLEKEAAHP